MIALARIVRHGSNGLPKEIFIAAGVSGLANAAVLSIINAAAHSGTGTGSLLRQGGGFILALLVYVAGLRASLRVMNEMSLAIVHRIRVQLAEKIESADLETIERFGAEPILNALTNETTSLSEVGEVFAGVLQAAVLIVFSSLYIAILSPAAFVVVLVFACGALLVLRRNRRDADDALDRAGRAEVEFLEQVGHSIDGFRETKLSAAIRDGLQREIERTSARFSSLQNVARDLLQRDTIAARTLFYILIGAVVFLLPVQAGVRGTTAVEITTAILFIIGPLSALAGLAPRLARCEAAARVVDAVERELDRRAERTGKKSGAEPCGAGCQPAVPRAASPRAGQRPAARRPGGPPHKVFQRIALDRVQFEHRAAAGDAFLLGPVSLDLRPGEIVFIVGGNGSGKSTLLKVVAGLYLANGSIDVDGVSIDAANVQSYRELFSLVLTDFHLFERLYGMRGADEARVRELLALMGIANKTSFDGTRFTNQRLSTGQRKRLAMIVAILEERPVLLFDEPAADQDPEFRRFLYEQLFPRLRADGRCVVVVTHDDRFFDRADRVVRMDYGRIIEEVA